MPVNVSIVARVTAVRVVVGLVFAAATTAIGYSKASAGLREQGEARLESDAVVVTRGVDAWTEQHLELAHSLADLPAVHRYLEAGDTPTAEDSEFINSIGVSLKKGMSDVTGFTLIDAAGITRITQGNSLGQSHANRDYFQNAIKGHDFVSGVSRKNSDGTPTIFIASPVKATDGHVSGVAQASGDPGGLQRLLDAEHQRTGDASRSLLMDEQGLIVANTVDSSWFLRPVVVLSPEALKADQQDRRWGNNPAPDAVGEQDLAPIIGTTKPLVFDWHSQGTTFRAVAMPLGKTHWTYITALPMATFEASTQDLLRTSAVAILIGLVLAIGAMVLFTRPLATALRRMTAAANRLAEGDVDERLVTAGNDEIGQMGAAFNAVSAYLQRLAHIANRMADGDLTQEITVASDRDNLGLAFARMQSQLQRIVGEVQVAAAGVAETSANVKASTAQTGAAAQHVADALEKVARGARETTRGASETNTAVEQGSAKADLAGRALGEILTAVQTTVQHVNEIAESAQEMASASRGMVSAMESISAVVEENTAATEEMAAQAVEVRGSIQSIAAVSQEQSAAVEEVSASTEEMAAQVDLVTAQANELAATADQLRHLVATFRLAKVEAVVPATIVPLQRAA